MSTLPQHIAIIMDGNGRWAQQRKLPRISGHNAGADKAKALIELCAKKHIKALTLYAFSLENRGRPATEVEFLMSLFLNILKSQVDKLHKNNIRLRVIGDRQYYAPTLLEQILKAEQLTASNTGLTVSIAVNYTGRWDIVQAAQHLARDVVEGKRVVDDIQADTVNAYLCLHELGDPDLLIRTSGEQRISNFMLWQFAYTELYFTETFWPDFDEAAFEKALGWYSARQRRFGLIESL